MDNNTKIKYEFVTGEVIEIEIESDIKEVVLEIERKNYNSNTRRHNSLEDMYENGTQFEDQEINISTMVEEKEKIEMLQKAMKILSLEQKELIQKRFFQGMPIKKIADAEDVDESAIRHRLKIIYKNLKKILN